MGQLINIESGFSPLSPQWYFDDAYYDHYNGGHWKYIWPNPSFPYKAAIHFDDLGKSPIKTQIRKWIERDIQDTVLMEHVDKSYRVYYTEDKDFNRSYEQSNHWMVFYFEDEHSATMFRLKFSDIVREMTDKHPNRPS